MAGRRPRQGSAANENTGLKRAEAAQSTGLWEFDATCAALLELMRDGVVVLQDGVCKYANTAAAQIGAYEVDELVGKPFLDFVAPESREGVLDRHLKRLERKPVSTLYEASLLRKDGTALVAEISASLVGYEGRLADMAVLRDITERKRAEAALEKGERSYRDLFENTLVGTFVIDAETTRIVLANQATAEAYGFDSPQQAIGVDPLEFIPVEDRDRAVRIIAEDMVERDLRQVNEFRTVARDGAEKWIAAVGTRTDYQGKPAGLISFIDITDRKRTEKLLQENEARYRLLAENTGDIIFTTDLDLNPTYISPSYTRVFGYSIEEAMGRKMVDALSPTSQHLAASVLAEELEEEAREQKDFQRSRTLELEMYSRDGSLVWLEVVVTFLRGEDGTAVGIVGVGREITARKATEQARQASEAKFRAVAEQSPNMVFIHHGGKLVYVNMQCGTVLGYSREEFYAPDFDFWTIIAPEFRDTLEVLYQRHTSGEEVPPIEYVLLDRDGARIDAILSTALIDYEGDVAILGTATDITEQKRMERSLRRKLELQSVISTVSTRFVAPVAIDEALHRSLAEIGACAQAGRSYVFLFSEDGTTMDNTHEWCAEGVHTEKHNLQCLPTDTFPWWMEKLRNGEIIHIVDVSSLPPEAQMEKETLESQDIKSVLVLPLHMADKLAGFVGFDNVAEAAEWGEDDLQLLQVSSEIMGSALARQRQMEEIKQHTTELEAMHHVLLSITQTLDLQEILDELVVQVGMAMGSEYTSIVALDEDGTLTLSSRCFAGVQPVRIEPRPHGSTRRVADEGKPIVVPDIDRVEDPNPLLVAAGIKSYVRVPVKAQDRTIGVLSVHSTESNSFAGKLRLLESFASQAAIAMENARLYEEAKTVAVLQEADRLKTELLSNVSHELRTPLASIKGYATSMLRFWNRLSNEDKLDSLNEINGASERLNDLVENLLQMSRLEMAGLHIDKEPVSMLSMVDQAVADMEHKATGHRFVTRCARTVPAVDADPKRVRQVIDNLLTNAVKYSPTGTEIAVSCQADEEEIVVSVRDQGRGIAKENLERVFDRFFQERPGTAEGGGGAGLGLAICRRVVEAHGGRIWVDSVPGSGSIFTFTLPVGPG